MNRYFLSTYYVLVIQKTESKLNNRVPILNAQLTAPSLYVTLCKHSVIPCQTHG